MHDANDMLSPVAPGTPIHLPVREGPIAAHANLLRQMLMLAGWLAGWLAAIVLVLVWRAVHTGASALPGGGGRVS